MTTSGTNGSIGWRFRLGWFLLAPILVLPSLFPIAEAALPTALEGPYAEAVLLRNAGKSKEAAELLADLQKKAPESTEIIELLALSLKDEGQLDASANLYWRRINLGLKGREGPKELLPYFFEVGQIRFRQDRRAEASVHFTRTWKGGFNPGVSRFYLGLIDFGKGRWLEAITHFDGTLSSSANELHAPAEFYKGQALEKLGWSIDSLDAWVSAKRLADGSLADPAASDAAKSIAAQVKKGVSPLLESLDRPRVFAAASFLGGYDSNVLSLPADVSGTEETRRKTLKIISQLGLGYATSPVHEAQAVASYRITHNYNLNRETREGEYLSQFLSGTWTRNPLNTRLFGARFDVAYLSQNQVSETTGQATQSPYSLTPALAGFYRHRVFPTWTARYEALLSYGRFFADPDQLEDLRRSGPRTEIRATLSPTRKGELWNPTLGLSFGREFTSGKTYRNWNGSIQAGNELVFSERLTGTFTFSAVYSNYGDRTPETRTDTLMGGYWNMAYTWTERWTLLSDASFMRNSSNLDETYGYSRFQVSFGIAYSL